MRIAIVQDSGCIEKIWAKTWAGLCEQKGIAYKLFNSYDSDFIPSICDYLPYKILWRSGHMLGAKPKDNMQRQFLGEVLNLHIIPDWNLHKYYDNKVLQTYLFQKKGYPHPETRVFYSKAEAKEYINCCEYPFVVKSNAGAGSKGTRFCFSLTDAERQLEECFGKGIEYGTGMRESGLMYIQRYIKAPGIFRIVIVKDAGYSFYQSNRPGTLIASSQGYDSYPATPIELLNKSRQINEEMKWQYCMYDWIWDEVNEKWLILEITDTCGQGHSNSRKVTHYLKNGNWIEKQDNTSPQALIFNQYIQ